MSVSFHLNSPKTSSFARTPLIPAQPLATTSPTPVPTVTVTMSSITLDRVNQYIQTVIDSLRKEITQGKTELTEAQQEAQQAEAALKHAQEKASLCAKKVLDLQKILSQKQEDFEAYTKDFPNAVNAASSSSSSQPMQIDPPPAPSNKRKSEDSAAPSSTEAVTASKKPRISGSYLPKNIDYKLLAQIFKKNTPVYYNGKEAVIQNFHEAEKEFTVTLEKTQKNVRANRKHLIWRPRVGEYCLIQDSAVNDSSRRYYLGQILSTSLAKSHLTLEIQWVEFGREKINRIVQQLNAALPIDPNGPLIKTILSEPTSTGNNKNGTAYYLQFAPGQT